MKLSAAAALVALGVAVSGCATLVDGRTQSVSVNTTPVEGAQCSLSNSEGTWFVTSPGSVIVQKTKSDLAVRCGKEGQLSGHVVAPSHFTGKTAGNIVFGVIGAPIAAGVDAASGANWHYDSPIVVPLTTDPFPIRLRCGNPDLNALLLQDGPDGYVTASVKFAINEPPTPGTVSVTPQQDGVCTLTAQEGVRISSASFSIGDWWTADGEPVDRHMDIIETASGPAPGSGYTFTVKAKDKSDCRMTLKFPIIFR